MDVETARDTRIVQIFLCTALFTAAGLLLQASFSACGAGTLSADGQDDVRTCRLGGLYAKEDVKNSKLRLAAIVQSFNHIANVENISRSLSESNKVDEVVICEDGSSDGSLREWAARLKGKSEVVIRSNNLHEMRSYNRAMRIFDSDIVVLLQDDDLIPQSDQWLEDASRLFKRYPNLGVLTGYIGQTWDYSSKKGFEFGEHRSTHGGRREGNTAKIAYVDPTLQIPFMFVECAWIAPLFVRRSLLLEYGGLDLNIAKIGEPGVWQDCILSFDAWTHGYQVGVYNGFLERGVGGHGSASSDAKMKLRETVWKRALEYSFQKYNRRRMHDYVTQLNAQTLQQRGS
mmetsp:Transcript_10904/g.33429  ORF Transcript_10904/g.33429 Transcript_10904/m.33429 type:complete len:344 (-) Transcript_10904:95-1126(-)